MARRRKSKKTKEMGKIKHIKTTIDNITFDSKTEANYYQYIKDNKKSLNIKKFELQPEFILQEKHMIINNQIVIPKDDKELRKLQKQHPGCTVQPIKYIADFLITYNDGTQDVIDVKGMKTADFKLKEKMFNFKYPQYGGLKCIVWYDKDWYEWSLAEKLKKDKKRTS